ncbi:MAG: hypothetical protein WC822_03410 [Candidatus Paceibacterota bacterium]|jgi:hypothetical protein
MLKIILFLAIFGVIVALGKGWRPSRPNVSFNWRWLVAVVVILVVGFVAYWIYQKMTEPKEPKTRVNSNSGSPQNQNPPPPIVGKIKTMYRFADYPDGIVRFDLKSEADIYPKGGAIKVVPPSGKDYIDTPGTAVMRPIEKPGKCTITPADSLAWGVEIWQ